MEWELNRSICRGFLKPSSQRGLRSGQELDYSSQSNSSRATEAGLASRAIANRKNTARPSASSCHFIQPTSDRGSGSVPAPHLDSAMWEDAPTVPYSSLLLA